MPKPDTSQRVFFVMSVPPPGVSEDEYSAFYETHIGEILETEGFVGARRYWLSPASPNRPSIEYRHLVTYLMDRPSPEPLADLKRRMVSEMTKPEWFGQIQFASFEGRPLEDEELDPPDQAYLVLSHAPSRFNEDEFYGWYYAHARENMTSEGFDTLWRYALTASTVDEAVSRSTHAALYETHGDLASLRQALVDSHQAGRVDIPDWMPEGEFVSWECHAITPARVAVRG